MAEKKRTSHTTRTTWNWLQNSKAMLRSLVANIPLEKNGNRNNVFRFHEYIKIHVDSTYKIRKVFLVWDVDSIRQCN